MLEDKFRIAVVLRKIGEPPAAQIVDDAHAIAAIEQMIHHMAADEAGAAGDDYDLARRAHCTPNFFIVRTL